VLFWTRGHSVENYFFVIESVQRYLEITYASILPVSYRDMIDAAFYPLMMQAFAFSLAAHEATAISKSDRIIELQNWSFDAAGQPCLDIAQVTAALSARAATAGRTALFESSYLAHLAAVPSLSLPFLRWISHGHLGSQVLWSGIAYLFSHHGFDTDSVEQLWRGQNDSKCKIIADLWAQRCADASPEETPAKLMAWLAEA